jgi:hypothetical protein
MSAEHTLVSPHPLSSPSSYIYLSMYPSISLLSLFFSLHTHTHSETHTHTPPTDMYLPSFASLSVRHTLLSLSLSYSLYTYTLYIYTYILSVYTQTINTYIFSHTRVLDIRMRDSPPGRMIVPLNSWYCVSYPAADKSVSASSLPLSFLPYPSIYISIYLASVTLFLSSLTGG